MFRNHYASILALSISAAGFACTTSSSFSDTSSDPPSPSNDTPASPSTKSAAPKDRLNLQYSAGRIRTTGTIASLRTIDGGTDAGADSGTTSTSVSTDAATYAYGAPITLTFANMSGDANDWVGFAPSGSSATTYGWYAYTNGALSGTASMAADDFLPPGTWVARAYFADGYTIEAESAPFTVGARPAETATLSSDKSAYTGFDTIDVSFSGLAGTASSRVDIAPTYGSTGLPFASADVGTAQSGHALLTDLLAGTYEARVFEGNVWTGTSTTFTVSPAVKTDISAYHIGDAVHVQFAGMQGLSMNDSVAIALQGSATDVYVLKQNVDWYWSGSRAFDTSTLSEGTYVARVYFDFSTSTQAESAPFTLAP